MYGAESQICKEAVAVYGKEQQLLMFFEEVGELMLSLLVIMGTIARKQWGIRS